MADEVKNYLGTQLRDKNIRLEGPMTVQESAIRTGQIVEGEKLPVTNTRAKNIGEAVLKILTETINLEKRK